MNSISAYALGTAVALALAAPASAQDAATAKAAANANASANASDDIIVTARRTDERLEDVPISITVLSSDAIAKRNIYNAGDLGTYVPSLTSNQQFGPEKSSFAIRGFTQEGKTAPSVGVYFAEVSAPRSNGGTTSGNGAGVGSFMDLQDVQVLKGPQGTLFGRNTTGGAILLVPAKPTDKLEGSLEGSVGDYSMHRVQGMLNVPLSDTFRVRGAFDLNKRDGYLINKSGIGPSALGDTDYFAGRISIVGDLTPNLENYTIASYSNSHNHGTLEKFLVCNNNAIGTPAGPSGLSALLAPLACGQIARQQARGDGFWDVENSDPDPYEKVKQWQVINTTTWKTTDTLTIKNITSYAEYREQADFELFSENFPYTGASQTAPDPTGTYFGLSESNPANFGMPTTAIQLQPGYSGNNSAESTFTEEFQLQGRSTNNRFNWQAGAYLEISNPLGFSSGLTDIFLNCTDIKSFDCDNRISVHNIYVPGLSLPVGSISNSQVKDTFNDKGFYAQATYKLTDTLSLTGGIRYTIDHIKNENQDVNIFVPAPGIGVQICQNGLLFPSGAPVANSAACDNTIKQNSHKPTWLIDGDYKPTNDLLLYAKWARGYREGAINPNNVGFETVGPEKVDTYEGGLKASFRGAMPGYFNFAGFYNNFTNQELEISPVIAPAYQGRIPNSAPLVNAGKSRIWGAEVDAAIRPFSGLKLDASYAYLNTKLLSDPGVLYIQQHLPVYYSAVIPTSNVGDPLKLSPKNRVTVTGTYTLPFPASIGEISVGATFTHTDSSLGVSTQVSPLAILPPSNLLNLNAEWKGVFGKPFDLSFFMTNATNEKLVVYPGSAYLTFGGETGVLNLPRMFGFRGKVYFGR